MLTTDLKQVELDEAYHLGTFDAEDAVITYITALYAKDREQCDKLINVLSEAINAIEQARLGPERYAALLERRTKKDAVRQ